MLMIPEMIFIGVLDKFAEYGKILCVSSLENLRLLCEKICRLIESFCVAIKAFAMIHIEREKKVE